MPAGLPDLVEETGQAPACMMGFGFEARRGAELHRERLALIPDIVAWLRTQAHREDTGEDPGRRIDGCEPRQRSDWFPTDGLNCWERALHFIAWQIVQFGTSENYEIRDSYLINNERHIFVIDKRIGRDLSFDIMPSGARPQAANAWGDDAGEAFGEGAVQGALEALAELGYSDESDAGGEAGAFGALFGGDAGAGAEAAARGAVLGALEGWERSESIDWSSPGEPPEAFGDGPGVNEGWTRAPDREAAPQREASFSWSSAPAQTPPVRASTPAPTSARATSAPPQDSGTSWSPALTSTIGSAAASAFRIADGLLQRTGLVHVRSGPDFTIEHRIDTGKWVPLALVAGLALVVASGKDKS